MRVVEYLSVLPQLRAAEAFAPSTKGDHFNVLRRR
jgi:hypothetical protein